MDVVINSIFNTEQENIKLINQQKKLKQISINSKNIAEFINTLIKKNNSKKINKEANFTNCNRWESRFDFCDLQGI